MDLLIHQGALGDWVLTFPILRALAPGPVGAVTDAAKARLAAWRMPHVRAIDIQAGPWSVLHAPGDALDPIAPPVTTLLGDASRIITFVSTGSDDWARRVRAVAPRARLLAVEPRPPADWPEHVTRWHALQLSQQGMVVACDPAAAATDDQSSAWVGRGSGVVVIHPGSGGVSKCWPAERFEAVIAALRRRGLTVAPLLGEAELERWPADRVARWTRDLGAAAPDSPLDMARHLARAAAFLGNDSGPAHLAADLGLPTVALFGPTSPHLWAPRGPRVAILAPPSPRPMDWLTTDAVLDAVLRAADRPAAAP